MHAMSGETGAPVLSKPKAILFDWDNTLIDSWAAIQDAQNHTLECFGLEPWTLEETRARVRGSMRDSYPILFGERWREAGAVFYKRFAERHMNNLRPLPGAAELLQQLHAAGVYVAVVSNKKGDYLRKEAEHLGWSSYFAKVVGAFDAERDKPWPEPVHLALSAGDLRPGPQVWLVGDADIDLECAVNTGCIPVLARVEAPSDGEFAACPPALHVDSCLTLSTLLANL